MRRKSWTTLLKESAPLLLPSAPDALTARLIERAGFPAYQIGGFALAAVMHAVPDVDLEHFGEKHNAAREIMSATELPVLIDADDGYGDVKNVTRTVRGYESMGAAALFIEDQRAPKRCGHMSGKKVIPAEKMEEKVRAAVWAKHDPEFFILARTDAREPEGLDSAIERAKRYRAAGADGVYIEGPTSVEELKRVGGAFRDVPLATSILEPGGKTPWLSPREMHELGFDMLLYPTTLLFRQTRAIEAALENLRAGRAADKAESVDLRTFERIVKQDEWGEIENRFMHSEHGAAGRTRKMAG